MRDIEENRNLETISFEQLQDEMKQCIVK
jgi:hypothetical protein